MRDIKWDQHKFCRDTKCENYYAEISECMAGEPEIAEQKLERKCYTNRGLFNSYTSEFKPDVKFDTEDK